MRLIDADALRQVLEVFIEKDTLGHTPLQLCDAMPTASPWHRCEDELPEIGKAVVVSIYGDMWVATRLDDKRFNGRMYWELSDGSWERVENDMYWMPIEPPKEEEHGN